MPNESHINCIADCSFSDFDISMFYMVFVSRQRAQYPCQNGYFVYAVHPAYSGCYHISSAEVEKLVLTVP